MVPKFGDMCDRQNWQLHPTDHILVVNIMAADDLADMVLDKFTQNSVLSMWKGLKDTGLIQPIAQIGFQAQLKSDVNYVSFWFHVWPP